MVSKQSQRLFSFCENPKVILFIVSIVSLFFLIDTSISYVADFLVEFNTSIGGLALFLIISLIYVLGQFFIVRYIGAQSVSIRLRSRFIRILYKTVRIVQYIFLANIFFVIVQIIVYSSYN